MVMGAAPQDVLHPVVPAPNGPTAQLPRQAAKEKIRLLEEKLLEEREVLGVLSTVGWYLSSVGWAIGGGGHRGVSAALFHHMHQFAYTSGINFELHGFILFFSLCSLKED